MAKRKTGFKTNEIAKPLAICLMCNKEFKRKNPRDYSERKCPLCREATIGIVRNYNIDLMREGGRIKRKGGGYRGEKGD